MDRDREPRVIDVEKWSRRSQFELFQSFGFPYFSLTASVDVAPLRALLKRKGISFTIGWVHALAGAANAVPALRQRMREDKVIEHETVHPSTTILTDDEQFSFCNLPYDENLDTFAREAERRIGEARRSASLFVEPDRDDFLFMTAIPWISFTAFVHPAPLDPPDYVPRFAWGRFEEEGDRIVLPLNIQAHHGLVDGIHVARFYERVLERIAGAKGPSV